MLRPKASTPIQSLVPFLFCIAKRVLLVPRYKPKVDYAYCDIKVVHAKHLQILCHSQILKFSFFSEGITILCVYKYVYVCARICICMCACMHAYTFESTTQINALRLSIT